MDGIYESPVVRLTQVYAASTRRVDAGVVFEHDQRRLRYVLFCFLCIDVLQT